MADATKLPTLSEITYVQLSRTDAPNPRLASAVSSTATTLVFTNPLLGSDGVVIAEALLLGIRDQYSYVETVYIPAGGLSVDGLTATGVIRGIDLDGLDWTVGDTSLAVSHKAGDAVFCNISGVIGALYTAAINGTIATGGTGFTIGTEPGAGGETVTIYRTTTAGVKLGIFRWNITTGKAEFSNDGAVWVANDDVSASDLIKVSAADTTAGYANDKITVTSGTGATVTKSITSPAGNEKLNIDVALDGAGFIAANAVDAHDIYTPAYLTGGAAAEGTFNNWLAVLDGEFSIDIDGVTYDIAAIDFTGVTSMNDVATYLQTAIRTATGSTETVTWSVDHFIITSADTTVTSAITVTSTVAAPAGTDISGAGAANWMDCDVGNGVVTAAVRNDAADATKLAQLDAAGYVDKQLLDQDLMSNETLVAKGDLIGASAASTVEILSVGSDNQVLVADSGETSGLKYQTLKKGVGDNGLGWASYPIPYSSYWAAVVGGFVTKYPHFAQADNDGGYCLLADMIVSTNQQLLWSTLSSRKFEVEIYARFTTGGTPANDFVGFGLTANTTMDIDTAFNRRVVVGIDDTGNLVINSANGTSLTSATIPGTFAVWRKYNLVVDYPNSQVLLSYCFRKCRCKW
jgi:hypothetical protein